MLQRYFSEGKPKHAVLVDEAHNLVDRSREMYSASLTLEDLSVEKQGNNLQSGRRAARALRAAGDELLKLLGSAPTGVPPPKPYHRRAFAAETIPVSLIEELRK